jgi:hypothetical protein
MKFVSPPPFAQAGVGPTRSKILLTTSVISGCYHRLPASGETDAHTEPRCQDGRDQGRTCEQAASRRVQPIWPREFTRFAGVSHFSCQHFKLKA